MFAYCNLVFAGTATDVQRNACGCGSNKPTSCSKQTDWATKLVKPPSLVHYGLTFLATGCCDATPWTGWWQTQSNETVFGDMYAHCVHVLDGTADATQREFCGCGSNKPTSCTKQVDWVLEAMPPASPPSPPQTPAAAAPLLDQCLIKKMKAKINKCCACHDDPDKVISTSCYLDEDQVEDDFENPDASNLPVDYVCPGTQYTHGHTCSVFHNFHFVEYLDTSKWIQAYGYKKMCRHYMEKCCGTVIPPSPPSPPPACPKCASHDDTKVVGITCRLPGSDTWDGYHYSESTLTCGSDQGDIMWHQGDFYCEQAMFASAPAECTRYEAACCSDA